MAKRSVQRWIYILIELLCKFRDHCFIIPALLNLVQTARFQYLCNNYCTTDNAGLGDTQLVTRNVRSAFKLMG